MTQSDTSFSVDQLRKEDWERSVEYQKNQKRIIFLLEQLRGLGIIACVFLGYLAFK